MKKIFALVLAALLMLSLFACAPAPYRSLRSVIKENGEEIEDLKTYELSLSEETSIFYDKRSKTITLTRTERGSSVVSTWLYIDEESIESGEYRIATSVLYAGTKSYRFEGGVLSAKDFTNDTKTLPYEYAYGDPMPSREIELLGMLSDCMKTSLLELEAYLKEHEASYTVSDLGFGALLASEGMGA